MKNILIPQGLGWSSHQISSFFLREKCHEKIIVEQYAAMI